MKTPIVVHVNSPLFRDNPDAIYIGRRLSSAYDARAHEHSQYANPFVIAKPGTAAFAGCAATATEAWARWNRGQRRIYVASRRVALAAYRKYATWMVREGKWTDLRELSGAVIGCWCAPEPCHGDVLAEIMEGMK